MGNFHVDPANSCVSANFNEESGSLIAVADRNSALCGPFISLFTLDLSHSFLGTPTLGDAVRSTDEHRTGIATRFPQPYCGQFCPTTAFLVLACLRSDQGPIYRLNT